MASHGDFQSILSESMVAEEQQSKKHQIDINSLVQTKHEALAPFEYGNAGVEYLIENTKRIVFMREEPV